MELEFFEPAEAAALMRCTEAWLREGASSGRFPHACWGKGKIIFTSEHIAEIARLSEILPGSADPALSLDVYSELGQGHDLLLLNDRLGSSWRPDLPHN